MPLGSEPWQSELAASAVLPGVSGAAWQIRFAFPFEDLNRRLW